MSDEPKKLTIKLKPKTLSIGNKAASAIAPKVDTQTPVEKNPIPEQTIKRPMKRIIRRDEVKQRAENIKVALSPGPKPTPKTGAKVGGKLGTKGGKLTDKKKKPPKRNPKKPIIKPSDIRLDNLNALLNEFKVWREYVPLAVGVEKQVFQHAAKLEFSTSKRVVMRLLKDHTGNLMYLQRLANADQRYNLDGGEAGAVLPEERKYAEGKAAACRAV